MNTLGIRRAANNEHRPSDDRDGPAFQTRPADDRVPAPARHLVLVTLRDGSNFQRPEERPQRARPGQGVARRRRTRLVARRCWRLGQYRNDEQLRWWRRRHVGNQPRSSGSVARDTWYIDQELPVRHEQGRERRGVVRARVGRDARLGRGRAGQAVVRVCQP